MRILLLRTHGHGERDGASTPSRYDTFELRLGLGERWNAGAQLDHAQGNYNDPWGYMRPSPAERIITALHLAGMKRHQSTAELVRESDPATSTTAVVES